MRIALLSFGETKLSRCRMRYDLRNISYSSVPSITMRSSRKKNNLWRPLSSILGLCFMHHIVGQKITVGGHLGVFCHGNVSEMPNIPGFFCSSWKLHTQLEHFSIILQGGWSSFQSHDGNTHRKPVSMQWKSVKPVTGALLFRGWCLLSSWMGSHDKHACFQETLKKKKLKKVCHLFQFRWCNLEAWRMVGGRGNREHHKHRSQQPLSLKVNFESGENSPDAATVSFVKLSAVSGGFFTVSLAWSGELNDH